MPLDGIVNPESDKFVTQEIFDKMNHLAWSI